MLSKRKKRNAASGPTERRRSSLIPPCMAASEGIVQMQNSNPHLNEQPKNPGVQQEFRRRPTDASGGRQPSDAFSHHFRELVVPKITTLIDAMGYQVASCWIGWTEAERNIMTYAVDRGAMHLPDRILSDLEDMIADRLLKAICEAESLVVQDVPRSERVTREWYDHLCALAAVAGVPSDA